MKSKILIVLISAFFYGSLAGQDLPNYYSEEELQLLPFYQNTSVDLRGTEAVTSPPSLPVRTAAEWEEMQGYLVTWTSYPSMLREIVRHGKEQCRMYIVTNNAANVQTDLQNNGIDTVNVTFLNLPYNSVWSRDYAPTSIYYNNVDSVAMVDWIYNRLTRKKDDTVANGLAKHLGLTLYTTTANPYKMVNTGGNWMSDGMGTAFASKLILDDNMPSAGFGTNLTETEIDTVMSRFHGIDRYIKMEKLPYDGIHHIDMHMKLLDEETLLVGEYPAGIADGPQIEANIQYVLSNFQTSFGSPYRVIRIPMPSDAGQWPSGSGDYLTYTNASFINKTIIVPTYNIPTDSTALRIWREACPGYKVVGINSTSSIPASGALHCITHEIGVAEPLLIQHARLRDTYDQTNPYTATAIIQHRSGIQSATLYYTTDTTQPYTAVTMIPQGNPQSQWSAQIPAQSAGTEVFYYIHAQASNGKQQVRPIVAPQGFYNFKVLGTTSIGNVTSNNTVEIMNPFPNPSKGITCLPVETRDEQKIRITLSNLLGQNLETIADGQTSSGSNNYFLNTQHLSAGVYLLHYKIGEEATVKRLVVK